MSYILDALRRADSERERGAVPSLHSKQIAPGVADGDDGDEPAGRSVQPLWWAVGGLSLALVGMAAWLVLGRSGAEPEPMRAALPVAQAPVLPAPPPAPQAQQPAPEPVAAQPAPVEPKSVPVSPPPAPAPARVAAAPKPAEKPADKPVAAAPAALRDEDTPVPSISELPDDIRRQLPTLSVSGASYSKNPASRMLILNGQVFKEGDKVANDLVLEQIRLKSAVLSFKGRRYSVSF
ncbi:general secretion pathway protein GspB [Piscinibacter gummiphilus]|uniref:General secretion pathway protein GspB n=1 Tax=Piscinibacter gummiphilus TaxID=946333 RepID=A0ABZ0D063_9BURK|nr:general secretion pathway protein GspB [Piscinibacter gummiphilus]WOB10583.1 general secretion pathway protein GspB [Piscinibacter gummiphilus]